MSNKAIELAMEWELAADDTPEECAPQFIEQCRDTSAELRRLHAEVEGLRKDAANKHKPFECFSLDDGCDFCAESPTDCALIDGKELGEKFELMCGWYAVRRDFVVTKVPDDTSDDYEVEMIPQEGKVKN